MKIIASLLLTVLSLDAGVYEDIEYGDTKQEVTDKLMACERVENTVPKTMFGRSRAQRNISCKKRPQWPQLLIIFRLERK